MPNMEVSLLGSILVDGNPLGPSASPRAQTTFGVLALNIGRPIRRQELARVLWGSNKPASADKAIQVYVSQLRSNLPPGVITTDRESYRLDSTLASTDAQAFHRMTDEGHKALSVGRLTSARSSLSNALRLWRNAPLFDVPDVAQRVGEVDRLIELYKLGTEDLRDVQLGLGEHERLVADLIRDIEREPLRERRTGQLMLALYRSGRQAEALRCFRALEIRLRDELGISPSPALVNLEGDILKGSSVLEFTPITESQSPSRQRSSVSPNEPSLRFVGRDRALEVLRGQLIPGTLWTICGPSGVGKSALARATLDLDELKSIPHIAVDILDIGRIDELAATVAAALNKSASAYWAPSPDRVLSSSIAQAIVYLDACETDLTVVRDAVSTLCDQHPHIAVLCTSVVPLNLEGERLLHIGPLGLPPERADMTREMLAASESGQLFFDRWSALGQSDLDPDSIAAIASLCRDVGGLPLGIELVAGFASKVGPMQLAAQVSTHIDLLQTPQRGKSRNPGNLRDAMAVSIGYLAAVDRSILLRCATCVGTWTVEAAEALCVDLQLDRWRILDSLARLVDFGLIRVSTATIVVKYSVLPPVQRYAREVLDQEFAQTLLDRHADFYLDGVADKPPRSSLREWMEQLEENFKNIHAALHHLANDGRSAHRALEIAISLRVFWAGHPIEGCNMIGSLLDAGVAHDARERAQGCLVAAELEYIAGSSNAPVRFEEGLRYLDGIDAIETQVGLLCSYSNVVMFQGDVDRAIDLAMRAMSLVTSSTDSLACANASAALGLATVGTDPHQARDLFSDAAEAYTVSGDVWGLAQCTLNLGLLDLMDGHVVTASHQLDQSLQLAEAGDHASLACWIRLAQGLCRLELADCANARAVFGSVLSAANLHGFRQVVPHALVGLAASYADSDPALAARLLGAAEATRLMTNESWHPAETNVLEATQKKTEAGLTPDRYRFELVTGKALSWREVLVLATQCAPSVDPLRPTPSLDYRYA